MLGEEGGGGGRPSSLARMGSKSTNLLCNSARAIASSVAFIRRFNSILSSSGPSTAAMAFCSARGWPNDWHRMNVIAVQRQVRRADIHSCNLRSD